MDNFPLIPGYRIEKKLGQNSLYSVYMGVHEDLDRRVAIQVLDPKLVKDRDFADRFLKESKKNSRFNHPNIATVLEASESGGVFYIVTEYLSESLRDKLTRHFSLDFLTNDVSDTADMGQFTNESSIFEGPGTLQVLKKLASALDYANKEGIIHKDITPENIRFRDDGTPLFTGFFLSRVIETAEAMRLKGFTFTFPHYVSPEHALRKTVDASSNIYSLGIIFFEMLNGSVPYHAEEAIAIENQHIIETVPRLITSLSVYQKLLDRMMAKNKIERFPNAQQLIYALDELIAKLSSQGSDLLREAEEEEFKLPIMDFSGPADQAPEDELFNNIGNEPLPGPIDDTFNPPKTETSVPTTPPTKSPGKPFSKSTNFHKPVSPREYPKFEMPDFSRFFSNLNLKIILPIICAVLLLGIGFIFLNSSGGSNDEENSSASTATQAENDMLFQRKMKMVQNLFNRGQLQRAETALKDAEKIQQTPETKQWRDKLVARLAEQNDHDTFKKALALNTADSFNAYVKQFPSGLHLKEVQDKLTALQSGSPQGEAADKESTARIKLRSEFKDLSMEEMRSMLKKYNFFDKYYNKDGKFPNAFTAQGTKQEKIVVDAVTGLMWHQSGTLEPVNMANAKKWLAELNKKGYGGYKDWRFPTLEELESLLENSESRDGLFIDILFDSEQRYLWAGDTTDQTRGWALDFFSGDVNRVEMNTNVYLRPVRTIN